MKYLMRTLSVACTGFALLFCTSAFADSAAGLKVMKEKACASCHDLTGKPGPETAGLWRKGPDLYYAGNKYNQSWLKEWLQNPKQVRPSGMFYLDHVESGKRRDMIRKTSFPEHVRLTAIEANDVASALSAKRIKTALIRAEKLDPAITAGSAGELLFDKGNGCMACHRIAPDYGGLSGPELYSAGKRLKPEYMLSFIREPNAWNRKTYMPQRDLSEEELQKLVNYIVSLSGGVESEEKADDGSLDGQGAVEDISLFNEEDGIESAAKNYRLYCMQCHGISGHGSGINSRDMAVPARNHSNGKYMQARSDAELFKVIKEGGTSISKSALMPPWKSLLTDAEIKDLVKHVRKLCQCEFKPK